MAGQGRAAPHGPGGAAAGGHRKGGCISGQASQQAGGAPSAAARARVGAKRGRKGTCGRVRLCQVRDGEAKRRRAPASHPPGPPTVHRTRTPYPYPRGPAGRPLPPTLPVLQGQHRSSRRQGARAARSTLDTGGLQGAGRGRAVLFHAQQRPRPRWRVRLCKVQTPTSGCYDRGREGYGEAGWGRSGWAPHQRLAAHYHLPCRPAHPAARRTPGAAGHPAGRHRRPQALRQPSGPRGGSRRAHTEGGCSTHVHASNGKRYASSSAPQRASTRTRRLCRACQRPPAPDPSGPHPTHPAPRPLPRRARAAAGHDGYFGLRGQGRQITCEELDTLQQGAREQGSSAQGPSTHSPSQAAQPTRQRGTAHHS